LLVKVGDLGEKELVKRILSILAECEGVALPFGDDAAAVHLEKGILVFNCDMLVARTDVPPGMTWRQVGWKTVVMNVSDLAAKGAKPIGGMYAFGFPRNFKVRDVLEVVEGIVEASKAYGACYLGGDVNEADEVVISGAVIGLARRVISREGAKLGDIVATTGLFGMTAVGLKVLLSGLGRNGVRKCVEAVYNPKARVNEGVVLAEGGYVSSSIDSSDGLAASLHELSNASNVGFAIEHVPIHPEVSSFAEENRLDPYELAFYGGEEYELVVTVPNDKWVKAVDAVRKVGGNLYEMGRVIEEKKVIFKHPEKGWVNIPQKGYEHFFKG